MTSRAPQPDSTTGEISPAANSAGSPLRIAVVGAGKMGQHHMRAIQRLGHRGKIVAVVDPSPAARDAIKALVPDAAVYPSLIELVAQQEIDVVHVATAPHTHEEIATLALEAGCNVYVEKPFVESTGAAERLLGLARSRGLKVCAGHQLLFEAPAREALSLMPALGEVVHLESYFSFRTVRRMAGGRVPLRADLQLLDILPHPVYLLLCFLEAAVPGGHTELTSVEIGPRGTVHALVRRGGVTGTLVVTLDGRPVESYMRVVGTNGMVHADFVRSTVQRLIGPGTSGIDKVLNPFRLARQLLTGTTSALASRILKRQRSYPGLTELFDAFYASVQGRAAAPFTDESILETVRIWERVARVLETPRAEATPAQGAPSRPAAAPVFVTGGTGFLGREVVRSLVSSGTPVRVLARRQPPAWEQEAGVEYVVGDLGGGISPDLLRGASAVIHCAAETAGGWPEHQRNSIDATRNVIQAAADAGVRRVIHVSSMAVLAEPQGGQRVAEDGALHANSKGAGPYVWGKLESERLAQQLGRELGVEVRVVRPGALVDYRSYDPPGRLGKRVGNIFVAVGTPDEPLGVVEVDFAGRALAWAAANFDAAPPMLNLLAPALPTRRDLVARLRRTNPDLTVVPLRNVLLKPLSWFAIGLQKVLRPGKPAMNVAKAFASQRLDNSLIARLAPAIEAAAATGAPAPRAAVAPGAAGTSPVAAVATTHAPAQV